MINFKIVIQVKNMYMVKNKEIILKCHMFNNLKIIIL